MVQAIVREATLAERALVIWDALLEGRKLAPSETEELRTLAEVAAEYGLYPYEKRGDIKFQQRRWYAPAGVIKSELIRVPRDSLAYMTEGRTRAPRGFLACVHCGFLLLPRTKRGNWRWTNFTLATARAHTDRCAMRFLIEREK